MNSVIELRAAYAPRSFWGMILRDLAVLRRGFAQFTIRTVMNPLLFVFIFTYVFPHIGQRSRPAPPA